MNCSRQGYTLPGHSARITSQSFIYQVKKNNDLFTASCGILGPRVAGFFSIVRVRSELEVNFSFWVSSSHLARKNFLKDYFFMIIILKGFKNGCH